MRMELETHQKKRFPGVWPSGMLGNQSLGERSYIVLLVYYTSVSLFYLLMHPLPLSYPYHFST